jgi:hypothetical protein
MATKDISDWQVCAAVHDMRQRQLKGEPSALAAEVVIEILQGSTGAPQKVCERALERAYRHGLVEAGMWFHGGWLTHDGILLLYLNNG